MKQKIFFFDIDNTLAVWPDGMIPESAQYCLDVLKKQGHRLSLATGRIQIDAKRFADRAGLVDFVADGGYSVTIDNELKAMCGMDRSMCINYLERLEVHGIPWAVTAQNHLGRVTPYEEILEWHPDWDVFKTTVDRDFDFHSVDHFYKMYVFFRNEAEERRLGHMTEDLIRYGEGCILYEPMDKARGIYAMIEYFQMDPSQVVVFGDGYNDLSMFKPKWFSIAMGNARDELKAKADYITTDCDKDGIYNACKHLGWL